MGDMADYINDQGDYDEPYDQDKNARCKYCRKSNFSWEKTMLGWRLFTKIGKLHECNKIK